MTDRIEIKNQEVQCRIGVPDEERRSPQRLQITTTLYLDVSGAGRSDVIENTIDYFEVYQEIQKLSEDRERRLIETLAEEIAEMILARFKPQSVEVGINKFILPNTDHVSVSIKRPL